MRLINANKVYYDNDFEKWYFEDDEDFENAQVVDNNYIKENQELKQQLAEKDKEIEKLHKALDSQKRHIDIIEQPFRGRGTKRTGNVILDFELSIRKKVCDEIKEKLKMNQYNTCENTAFDVHYDELKEILDQIEQGE